MMEIEITTGPKTSWIPAATRGLAIVLRILMVVGAITLLWIESARAALVEGGRRGDLLFGADDDDQQNPLVQPPGAPNQSLNDTDVRRFAVEAKVGLEDRSSRRAIQSSGASRRCWMLSGFELPSH